MSSDPAGAFVAAGQVVTTDANTVVRFRNTTVPVSALAVGQRVHVKGQSSSSGVLASLVMIQQGPLATGGTGAPEPPPPPPPDVTEPPPPPPPTPAAAFDPEPIQGQAQCLIYTCGFAFSVSENISVQALGQWDANADGLGTTAPVGLWSIDGTDVVLIASVVVPSGTVAALDGAYRYVTLDEPVDLVVGRTYVIGSAMASSTTPTFNPSGAHSLLTLVHGRTAAGGGGVLLYPASASSSFFGGANFLFVPAAP